MKLAIVLAQLQLLLLCTVQATASDSASAVASAEQSIAVSASEDDDSVSDDRQVHVARRTLKKKKSSVKVKNKKKKVIGTKPPKSKTKANLISPSSGDVVDASQGVILKTLAKDDAGIKTVTTQLSYNGGDFVSHTSSLGSEANTFQVNLLGLAAGSYQWFSLVETNAGQTRTSLTFSFTVAEQGTC